MTRSRVLDQTDLFGQMPPELLAELSGRTALSKYRRNELICQQGETADHLFIVFSGRVAITVRASDGRESVVAVLGPGALFGELPLFDSGVRSADARALGTVHLISVHYDDVGRVLEQRPEVLWAVVRILGCALLLLGPVTLVLGQGWAVPMMGIGFGLGHIGLGTALLVAERRESAIRLHRSVA